MSAHAERKSFVVSVTLTELMFLLFFLLLLAAVYRLVHLERDLGRAHAELETAQRQASQLRQKFEAAKWELSPSETLSDEAFIELVRDAVPSKGPVREQLRDLRSRLLEAQRAHGEASARAEQLEKEIADLRSKDPSNALASLEKCESDTSNLRGQVMNCQSRLGKGGMDYPPCWADDTGKVEYLLEVTMDDEHITSVPAWPENRAADADALPGVRELIDDKQTPEFFSRLGQPLLVWSQQQNPECRHYVRILDKTTGVELHKRARYAIESVFYKYEVR